MVLQNLDYFLLVLRIQLIVENYQKDGHYLLMILYLTLNL